MLVAGLPALLLAPMEGVTDAPMRALFGEQGAFSFAVSEFIRVSHQVPPAKVFLRHVPELPLGCKTPSGLPVQIQLLGGNPERMAGAAQQAHGLGAWGIDINFGCPAPTVNRHDGGATLLRYPDRICAIVRAVRAALPAAIPVSAKLRLGWSCGEAIYENAQAAASGGAAWITIHGRTKEQGYRPPAYWEPIGKVRAALSIPVVANGDIWTLEDFRECRWQTGCAHFMLGRGALADPLLPSRIAQELGLAPPANLGPVASIEDWLPWFQRFERWEKVFPAAHPGYLHGRTKQWLRFAHSRKTINWFDAIKRCQSYSELRAQLDSKGKA